MAFFIISLSDEKITLYDGGAKFTTGSLRTLVTGRWVVGAAMKENRAVWGNEITHSPRASRDTVTPMDQPEAGSLHMTSKNR